MRRAGALRQPGWGCGAGRSARPRLRPPDPHGPAQGSRQTAIRPLQGAPVSARTGRGAGPTRGPPAVPLPKPSLPKPRLLKEAPPHNLGVPLSLLKAATKAPGAVARQAPPGKEAQAVLHLRIPGGGGGAGVALGLA